MNRVVGAATALAAMLLAPATAAQESNPADARAVLRRMARTESATYRARQLVVYFGTPQSAAVLDVRSSAAGRSVRAESGEDVTRLWRKAGIGIVSSGRATMSDTSLPAVALRPSDILAKYEVQMERSERLFGLDILRLVLVRRSDRAATERLWVDPESGFVYRRELYGAGGKLVGLSAILDMRWGGAADAEPMERAVEPSRVTESDASDAPRMLPNGYRLLGTYRIRTPQAPAEHWVYSDGMHALSIFRTNGSMRTPAGFEQTTLDGSRAWTGPGPGTWAWEGGGRSWVVVAEEPALDAAKLTEQLPKGGPSVWSRLGSVWARAFRVVGGLFN
ncbi:MAG TPA: hypothetical protein VFA34_05170 [Actinomycetota bacterium]|nr:hypothetical protein [Actinomycetota bacterium]